MLKKILSGFLIVVGLGILYLVYAGGMTPKYSLTTVIEVNAPLEKSFEIFNDAERMAEWMQSDQMSFKSIELIAGAQNEVGSQYKLIFDEQGRNLEMIETLTAFEKNKRVAFNLTDEFADFDLDITFQEKDGKTIITEVNSEGKALPFFSKAMVYTFSGMIEDQKKLMYGQLKTLIEQEQ